MKCPYRLNIQYPNIEGENWAYQSQWNDCVSGCPFLENGKCTHVGAVQAQKAYYEAFIAVHEVDISVQRAARVYYEAGTAYFEAALEAIADTKKFQEDIVKAVEALEAAE